MLSQVYKRAVGFGGAAMSAKDFSKLLGKGHLVRRTRNVLRACENQHFGVAVAHGLIQDHRVIESLVKLGPDAARIVIKLELKLGRKLTRHRVQTLTQAYLKK